MNSNTERPKGYIKQLQEDNKTLNRNEQNLLAGLEEIKRYLSSEKFYIDTTVQVRDVLYRLEEIKSNYKEY